MALGARSRLDRRAKSSILLPIESEFLSPIAKTVFGANGLNWVPAGEAKAKMLEDDPEYADYATMMVKTHTSLTDDPAIKDVPKDWTLPIRDVLI